jgi:hypothetical protein
MASARQRSEWSRASSLMCLIANIKRDRKKRLTPYTPDNFDPTRTPGDVAPGVDGSVATLAALIPGSKYTPKPKA